MLAAAILITVIQSYPLFEEYTHKYHKTYLDEEKQYREDIFMNNYRLLKQLNATLISSTVDVSMFSDMTPEEIAQYFHPLIPIQSGNPQTINTTYNDTTLPDWRAAGKVSPVKFQGSCSACYAFAAISTVESLYAIQTGQLVEFSEQELIDCATIYGSRGCGGGWVGVYDYIKSYGIHLEEDYAPFMSYFEGRCLNNINIPPFYKIKGYLTVPPYDNDALLSALRENPVWVTAYVSRTEFLNYKSGILDLPDCGVLPQHALTLVGAGTENGVDFWLIKNSWSMLWGDKGYIKLKRESGKSIGMCGINLYGFYPYN